MNLTDSEVNNLYGRSVKGCLKSREALYNQYAAFLNSLCSRQRNKQFPVNDLMSFANDTFMNIIERNLFDPSKGIKFISYLGRSVSMELIRLKIRYKDPITNKRRVQNNAGFLDIIFNDIDDHNDTNSDPRHNIPKELWSFDEKPSNQDKKEILNNLLNTLTKEDKMILLEHYKLIEPTKRKVSRQAVDQKRYKIENKLKIRLKELQNKGEL